VGIEAVGVSGVTVSGRSFRCDGRRSGFLSAGSRRDASDAGIRAPCSDRVLDVLLSVGANTFSYKYNLDINYN